MYSSLSASLNEENDIINKQSLIKAEILDKNYDKNLFFDFCLAAKPQNGDDLANWSMDELKEVIRRFTEEQEQKNQIALDKEQKIKDQQAQAESIQLNMEQIRSNKAEEYHTSPYIKEIQCKKLEKSPINDKKVEIIIKNPKPVETGFFTSNYITYEVLTTEVNWGVRRRYSDFVWLRDTLCKFYPRMFVPPMPSKKIGSRRFEVDFVEKRMKFLTKFMANVMENETFKASEPLTAFLSMTDRSQFEMKMRELTSFTPSMYIEDIKNIQGKVYISNEGDTNEKYYTNINNYFKLQYQLFARLNYNMKNFYVNINAAVTHLDDVQKDFEMLHLLNSKVQMKEEVTRTYEELGIFFKNWKRMLYNQNEIIKSNIKDFFKYIQMEGTAYEELIHSREEIKNRYVAENAKLTAKKDKLWAAMDISKWEITEDMNKIDRVLLFRDKIYATAKMCTVETQMVENLKKQLGYANRSNIDELKKLISKYCVSYIKNLKEFSDQMYPSLNDGLNIWTGLTAFSDVY